MVVDRKPTAETLGKVFAKAIRDDDAVREIWVTDDRDGFIISILTDEIDADHERRLYAPAADVQRRFPEALFEVHVSNSSNYPGLTYEEFRSDVLPAQARKIPLER